MNDEDRAMLRALLGNHLDALSEDEQRSFVEQLRGTHWAAKWRLHYEVQALKAGLLAAFAGAPAWLRWAAQWALGL